MSNAAKTNRDGRRYFAVSAQILALAEKHVGKGSMIDSAALCLTDALDLFGVGRDFDGETRALKSIAYSVGIMSPDYQLAQSLHATPVQS